MKGEKIKKDESKKDWFSYVMIAQTVVCGVIILLLVWSAKTQGSFAEEMGKAYIEFMSADFSEKDYETALKHIREYVYTFSQDKNETDKSGAVNVFSAGREEAQSENSSGVIGGGIDLEFDGIEALEGICFDEYTLPFSLKEPLEEYEITSGFGYRKSPLSGEPGMHTGLDMAAGYGTEIHAAAGGTVADAAYDSSYGNYVKILHSDNIVTIYAHCSSLCVEEGETVRQGDVIALVGSTGASTGNHLHFEMRKDNIRINPSFGLFGNDGKA